MVHSIGTARAWARTDRSKPRAHHRYYRKQGSTRSIAVVGRPVNITPISIMLWEGWQ